MAGVEWERRRSPGVTASGRGEDREPLPRHFQQPEPAGPGTRQRSTRHEVKCADRKRTQGTAPGGRVSMSLISRTPHAHVGVGAGRGGSRVRNRRDSGPGSCPLSRSPGPSPAARLRKRGKEMSDTDPRTAAQLTAVADAWPAAAVIDMEGSGNRGRWQAARGMHAAGAGNDPPAGPRRRRDARPAVHAARVGEASPAARTFEGEQEHGGIRDPGGIRRIGLRL